MVGHAANQRQEVRTAMRGGNGSITLTHLLEGSDTFGKSRMMAKLVMPAGASISEHPHVEEAEAYIILSGEATVTENGVVSKLGSGEVMFTGNGDSHSIENCGTEDLILYAIIFN